jgi:hypothetical protein
MNKIEQELTQLLCINQGVWKTHLTKGMTYDLIEETDVSYKIIDNYGKEHYFNKNRFTVLENNKQYKFVIIDLRDMDFMKDEDGNINYYDTVEEAGEVCGMYEFENAWVCELMYNHIEK